MPISKSSPSPRPSPPGRGRILASLFAHPSRRCFAALVVQRLGFVIVFLGMLTACSAMGAAPAAETHRLFEWRLFLAPFHAVVLHLPIGFITVAFILELFRMRRPGEEIQRATT